MQQVLVMKIYHKSKVIKIAEHVALGKPCIEFSSTTSLGISFVTFRESEERFTCRPTCR